MLFAQVLLILIFRFALLIARIWLRTTIWINVRCRFRLSFRARNWPINRLHIHLPRIRRRRRRDNIHARLRIWLICRTRSLIRIVFRVRNRVPSWYECRLNFRQLHRPRCRPHNVRQIINIDARIRLQDLNKLRLIQGWTNTSTTAQRPLIRTAKISTPSSSLTTYNRWRRIRRIRIFLIAVVGIAINSLDVIENHAPRGVRRLRNICTTSSLRTSVRPFAIDIPRADLGRLLLRPSLCHIVCEIGSAKPRRNSCGSTQSWMRKDCNSCHFFHSLSSQRQLRRYRYRFAINRKSSIGIDAPQLCYSNFSRRL